MHRVVPGDLVRLRRNNGLCFVYSSLDAFDLVVFNGFYREVENNEKFLVVSTGLMTAYAADRHKLTVCVLIGSDKCLWYAYEREYECIK